MAIATIQELEQARAAHPALLVYFDTPSCAVGSAVEPKLCALLQQDFPRMVFARVDTVASPALAAQCGVTATPTVLAYFEGREHMRKSRSFSVEELRAALARPYGLMFE